MARPVAATQFLQHPEGDFPVGLVIVHYQHVQAELRGVFVALPVLGFPRRLCNLQRQFQPERAADARLALQLDPAPHQACQLAADRQSQPRSPVTATVAVIGLSEALEDRLLAMLGNADAGIPHGHADRRLALAIANQPGLQDDRAGLGELHRVAREVGEDLSDAGRVAHQPLGDVRRDQAGDLQALAMGTGGQQVGHILHQHPQVEVHRSIASFPASIFDRSRMSLMMVKRASAL